MHGACMSAERAARYCGARARWDDGACVPLACIAGQVLDEMTGECLGARQLRATFEGHTPECRAGSALRVADGHPRCDEPFMVAPRDRCDAGAVLDPRAKRCLRVVDERGVVNVATWARAMVGANGEGGAEELCARVTLDPFAYGLPSGAESSVDVDVEIVFPDNDVTLVHARTRATGGSGIHRADQGVPSAADAMIQRAVGAEIEALRALGGTSDTASFTTRIGCAVRAGSHPRVHEETEE